MVASIAFIVFFFAGGQLADDVVRIHVVNVKFQNPIVLAVIAWLMLFWFVYRYWLTHSGIFKKEFAKELVAWSNKPFVRRYIGQSLGQPIVEDAEEGYHVQQIELRGLFLFGRYRHAASVSRSETGEIASYRQTRVEHQEGEVRFHGVKGLAIACRVLAECFYLKPSFSNYAVPYVLFVMALLGGAWRAL